MGGASAKAALPVLSLLSFDVFDFPVPRCLSLIHFACFSHLMDVIFFLPFEALKETFIYIFIYFNVRLWARRGFPGLGLNSLKECAHTFRGPFFHATPPVSVSTRTESPALKRNHPRYDTLTGHMSGGKHLQSRFCKRHICFSASRLQ